MFEVVRRLLGSTVLAVFYATAPSWVPEWRLHPALPPAVVLPVGEPMPSLSGRRAPRTRTVD